MHVRLALFFLLLFISTASLAKNCDSPLVLAFSASWKPYFYSLDNSQYDGVDYEILDNVANAIGCEVVVLSMSEARSQIETHKGSFDVSLGASSTPSRQEKFLFSFPYREEQIGVILATQGQYDENTKLKDLLEAGGIVAINQSGYLGEKVKRLQATYPTQFVHKFSLGERIRLLTNKGVDAIVDDRLALCVKLQEMRSYTQARPADPPEQNIIVLTNEILHSDNIHFMFSKQTTDREFVSRFDAALVQYLNNKPFEYHCPGLQAH